MKAFTLAFFFCLFVVSRGDPSWNPIANPAAVVVEGNARFTVLTDSLIRIEYSAAGNGTFEDRATVAVVNRYFKKAPAFNVRRQNGVLFINTSKLSLTYRGRESFSADNLEIKLNEVSTTWTFGQKNNQDSGNLLGTLRTLDGADGGVQLDCDNNQYSDWLFCTYGLISRNGWATVDETKQTPLIPNAEWEHWVDTEPHRDAVDTYFFGHGQNYRQALSDFTQIGGEIPLPPRYTFGIWFSRYWAYSDEESKDIVNQYEIHQTPLDVLVTDMDWHITFYELANTGAKDQAGETPGWTGYTWDKNLFPNPSEFLEFCKSRGLKNTLNLHPASGVQPHEERYPEMAIASGIDPATRKYVPFNITSAKYVADLHDIMLKPVWQQGIDFWWLDWQQGESTTISDLNPTIWLNHVFWKNYERWGLTQRPTIFHRWGGLGNHRYQIGFSGDVVPSWSSLAFQPYFTATASNVGYAFWSHDLGGHTTPSPPELYTRWNQWGLFSPVFRPHCTKGADNDRRIWTYPLQNFLIMRDIMTLRSSLVPHIYTLARRTHDSGVASIVTPLYYDYSQYPQSYKYMNEFAWGDTVLVAPVTSPVSDASGLAATAVFLPQGHRWVNWFTGKVHDASKTSLEIVDNFTLPEIPAYVKAGSVISYWPPSQKPLMGSAANPPQVLGFQVFVDGTADSANTLYRLYDDAGDDNGYKNYQYTWTSVHFKQIKTYYELTVYPPSGAYPGMATRFNFEFKFVGSWPASSITINGAKVPSVHSNDKGDKLGWRYDGEQLALIVNAVGVDRTKPVYLTVELSQPLDSSLFSGVSGLIRRAKDGKKILDSEWGINTIYQEDYTSLVQLSELGSLIGSRPEEAQSLLKTVAPLVQSAVKQLESISYGAVDKAKLVARQLLNEA